MLGFSAQQIMIMDNHNVSINTFINNQNFTDANNLTDLLGNDDGTEEVTQVKLSPYVDMHEISEKSFTAKSNFSITSLNAQSGGSNYDSLFVRTVAFPVQVAYWIKEVMAPRGYSVPCQFWPWSGDMVVGSWGLAGGDPRMTGCLESPLVSPVLAQSWSQTATDGAWFSTTALLSGRDRPRCLCVLRRSGSEPKTRRTGKVATSLPSISLPVGARW